MEDILGVASAGAAGFVGIDWSHINAPATTVDLSGTTIKNLDSIPPGVTTPPTTAQIATAVWQDLTSSSDFTTTGSVGALLATDIDAAISSRAPASTALSTVNWTMARAGYLDNLNVGGPVASHADVASLSIPTVAQISTGVWQDLTTSMDFGTAGSIGLLLKTDIDTTISSRAPVATALSTAQWTNTRAANLDNLDVTVSSRAPAVTALTNATWTDARAGYLDNLNVGGPVASHADIVALTASIPTPPTVTQIATAVWQDATPGDFTITSSIGKSLYTGVTPGAANGLALVGSNMGTVVSVTGSVGSVTGSVTGSVGSVTAPVGIDWSRIANPTAAVDLSNTTIKTLDTPPPGIPTPPTPAQIATAVWTDPLTTDFGVPGTIGHLQVLTFDTNIGSRMPSGPVTVSALSPGIITNASFSFNDGVSGPASGLLDRLNQLWRRFFKRVQTGRNLKNLYTYADDGTTVLTTQSISSSDPLADDLVDAAS
jgi:hypothetical protein